MKARPILFSAPMVLALLEGRKTQTRRILKPQPDDRDQEIKFDGRWLMYRRAGIGWCNDQLCPYGVPGDLLWVREAWLRTPAGIQYRADGAEHYGAGGRLPWHSPYYMRRAHSRLTLRITDARVQRLQEISVEDAASEGLKKLSKDYGKTWKYGIPDRDGLPGDDNIGWHWTLWRQSPIDAYAHLWDKINGAGAWDGNPWVWALTFEVIKQNVDTVIYQRATA